MGKSSRLIKIFILTAAFFWLSAGLSLAADSANDKALNLKDAFKNEVNSPLHTAANVGAGFDTSVDANTIIGLVIQAALGLIGVIFFALAIYAGYNWMIARGNEEAVTKAKNTLTNAIIGLIIVLAAYAISWFILDQISAKTLRESAGQGSGTEIPADFRSW